MCGIERKDLVRRRVLRPDSATAATAAPVPSAPSCPPSAAALRLFPPCSQTPVALALHRPARGAAGPSAAAAEEVVLAAVLQHRAPARHRQARRGRGRGRDEDRRGVTFEVEAGNRIPKYC